MSDAATTTQQVWGILLGKPVVDATGRRVGRVVRITPTQIVVRCGYLFHKDRGITREDIDRYDGGKLVLKALQG